MGNTTLKIPVEDIVSLEREEYKEGKSIRYRWSLLLTSGKTLRGSCSFYIYGKIKSLSEEAWFNDYICHEYLHGDIKSVLFKENRNTP